MAHQTSNYFARATDESGEYFMLFVNDTCENTGFEKKC